MNKFISLKTVIIRLSKQSVTTMRLEVWVLSGLRNYPQNLTCPSYQVVMERLGFLLSYAPLVRQSLRNLTGYTDRCHQLTVTVLRTFQKALHSPTTRINIVLPGTLGSQLGQRAGYCEPECSRSRNTGRKSGWSNVDRKTHYSLLLSYPGI